MSCQSTRGEWGKLCPDCGQRLPARRPWAGWTTTRAHELDRLAEVRSRNSRLRVAAGTTPGITLRPSTTPADPILATVVA